LTENGAPGGGVWSRKGFSNGTKKQIVNSGGKTRSLLFSGVWVVDQSKKGRVTSRWASPGYKNKRARAGATDSLVGGTVRPTPEGEKRDEKANPQIP